MVYVTSLCCFKILYCQGVCCYYGRWLISMCARCCKGFYINRRLAVFREQDESATLTGDELILHFFYQTAEGEKVCNVCVSFSVGTELCCPLQHTACKHTSKQAFSLKTDLHCQEKNVQIFLPLVCNWYPIYICSIYPQKYTFVFTHKWMQNADART